MFTVDGKNVAAGSPPQGEQAFSYWTTYIASDDVDATAAKIREAGGTVMFEPMDVFDAGRMTVALDRRARRSASGRRRSTSAPSSRTIPGR